MSKVVGRDSIDPPPPLPLMPSYNFFRLIPSSVNMKTDQIHYKQFLGIPPEHNVPVDFSVPLSIGTRLGS